MSTEHDNYLLVPFRGSLFLIRWCNIIRREVVFLVPFRGSLFLIPDRILQKTYVDGFSSPFGGVYFLSPRHLTLAKGEGNGFSSPFGGVYFLSRLEPSIIRNRNMVLVPFRGSLFLIVKSVLYRKICGQFSSPFGGVYFLSQQMYAMSGDYWFSSPFGGVYFLSYCSIKLAGLYDTFSSPFGGVYFLSDREMDQDSRKNPFSSPFGGVYFLSNRRKRLVNVESVLVPFRGSLFLIEGTESVRREARVLVPFRGSLFLIKMPKIHRVKRTFSSRPLSGESISYPDTIRKCRTQILCSRPLSGESISYRSRDIEDCWCFTFSSPFGGVYFLSWEHFYNPATGNFFSSPFGGVYFLSQREFSCLRFYGSSRPLSGESISYPIADIAMLLHVCVLVPFRGSLFLITIVGKYNYSKSGSRPLSGESISYPILHAQ